MCHILASISQWFSSFHNYFILTCLSWNSQMPCYLDCCQNWKKNMLRKIHPGIKLWVTKILYQKIFPRGNIFLIHFIWIYWVVFWGKYFWRVSSMLSYRRSTQRGDQDGGIGGHWANLPSWTYQKYIYIWSNSCWKQTGIWQKDCCTTKALRIRQEEKGRDQVGIGTPVRAHRREDYIDWVPSLGNEMLKPQTRAIGSATGWVPIDCSEDQWDWQEQYEKLELHSWRACTCWNKAEKKLRQPRALASFLWLFQQLSQSTVRDSSGVSCSVAETPHPPTNGMPALTWSVSNYGDRAGLIQHYTEQRKSIH